MEEVELQLADQMEFEGEGLLLFLREHVPETIPSRFTVRVHNTEQRRTIFDTPGTLRLMTGHGVGGKMTCVVELPKLALHDLPESVRFTILIANDQ